LEGLSISLNPCPCGFYTDPKKACHCSPVQIQRYLSRISGPMLDRIDIHVEVPPLKYKELASEGTGKESLRIGNKVSSCRRMQGKRFKRSSTSVNARMTSRQIKRHCRLKDGADALLKQAVDEFGISARAYTRILKVGRTVADLDGSEYIGVEHIAEAIQYRMPHSDIWE
jgi:magnesium chelatase family protein